VTATDFEAIRDLLGSIVPFNTHVGVRVLEVGSGIGRCALTQQPHLGNHIGTLHAGALFTLAEAASGAAIVGHLGDRIAEITPIARGAQIRYVKPARDEVTASATLAACDDRSAQVDVTIEDASGEVVAEMSVDWVLKPSRA
jgi:uncharacterized protein (TIGR00369 family)